MSLSWSNPPNLWTSHPGPQAVVFPGFGPFFLSLRIGPKWQIGMDSPYMFPLNLWVVSVFSYPIFDVAWYVFWYFCLIISLKPTVCTWNRPFAPKGNHPHSIHVCYIYHHLSTWMVGLYGFHVGKYTVPSTSHVHAFSGIPPWDQVPFKSTELSPTVSASSASFERSPQPYQPRRYLVIPPTYGPISSIDSSFKK